MFGSLESANTEPGRVLYVTLDAQGACIIQGDTSTLIPAVSATGLDPTGADDTFCGATLAYLLQKKHPIMAARHAVTSAAEVSPFPFVSPELPHVGHPKALDYFFAATLQQFSFWSEQDNRYDQPLIATIGGVEQKGSDYLWDAFRRRIEQDAYFCSPERQASLSREELLEVFRADNGDDPDRLPSMDLEYLIFEFDAFRQYLQGALEPETRIPFNQ